MSKSILTEINRFLIAISLIATPVNPYIFGMTLYIWIILIFFDFEFLSKLKFVKLKYILIYLSWITLALIEFKIIIAVKLSILFLGILYLCTQDEVIFPKIKIAFIISCFFCIAQFFLYYIDPSISASIAGINIGTFIWGENFATPAYVNQYVVFLFPRMAGLSREAGFFVSLLGIMVLLILSKRKKISFYESILYISSYFFSLSKVSISVIFLFFLLPFKNILNKIPLFLSILTVISLFILLALKLDINHNGYFYINESIAHRLSSSSMVLNMKDGSFLLGCNENYNCTINNEEPLYNYLNSRNLTPNTGVNGVWVDFGLLGIILLSITLFSLKVKTFDFLVLVLITSTVTLFTLDNFVILTYYYILINCRNSIFNK
ncbi:hypothetical protein [Acinetobacter pollinis]|uniref:O-antigen ligase domain-containing protein n=1 Tax=Acinetobacter pollinis TaxID=2605270 RepID=A0ABU6DSI3_9GAMM|nr:hypothetical protein [Acinetobacter pollinis]MEB5476804.1 hypothetical protein [Acinetobacter pollinis]